MWPCSGWTLWVQRRCSNVYCSPPIRDKDRVWRSSSPFRSLLMVRALAVGRETCGIYWSAEAFRKDAGRIMRLPGQLAQGGWMPLPLSNRSSGTPPLNLSWMSGHKPQRASRLRISPLYDFLFIFLWTNNTTKTEKWNLKDGSNTIHCITHVSLNKNHFPALFLKQIITAVRNAKPSALKSILQISLLCWLFSITKTLKTNSDLLIYWKSVPSGLLIMITLF